MLRFLQRVVISTLMMGPAALHVAAENAGADRTGRETIQLKALPVRIFVDASGQIQRFAWQRPELVAESLNAYLASQIKQISFEPATVNGKPESSELLMNAILKVETQHADQQDVAFVTLEKFGVTVTKSGTPKYPSAMLMNAVSAYVVVVAEIGPDGKAIESTIALDSEPKPKDAQRIREFFREAKRALLQTQFELTEKVGERLVGGVIRMPYKFCIQSCDLIDLEIAKIQKSQAMVPTKASGINLAQMKQNRLPDEG